MGPAYRRQPRGGHRAAGTAYSPIVELDQPRLITTLGPRRRDEVAAVLPHEHVFVDLRTPDDPRHAVADTDDVVRVMAPELRRARAAGIGAIVEASTVGVGRRVDILRAVSDAAAFPLVAPTGIYREPWVPGWAARATEDQLADWMHLELSAGIESTGVVAGWIKLSAGDDGLTTTETRILRAAARAARETRSTIGSHTVRGRVVREQLAILDTLGFPPQRFVWIHTQAETDVALHAEIARRGAWLEYDAIGSDDFTDEFFVDRVVRLLEAGLGDRLLLSQDRGQYDPAQRDGGTPRPFTYLVDTFLPKLQSAGVDDATVAQLIRINPFDAFAR
jgi:phosphotriesterase-related protein